MHPILSGSRWFAFDRKAARIKIEMQFVMFIKNTFLQNLTLDLMCVLPSSSCHRHSNVNINTIAEIKLNIPYNITIKYKLSVLCFDLMIECFRWKKLLYSKTYLRLLLEAYASSGMGRHLTVTSHHLQLLCSQLLYVRSLCKIIDDQYL